MMIDRIRESFERYRSALRADDAQVALTNYDNDLEIGAWWGDRQRSVRIGSFIPAGGLSDEELGWIMRTAIKTLCRWRERNVVGAAE